MKQKLFFLFFITLISSASLHAQQQTTDTSQVEILNSANLNWKRIDATTEVEILTGDVRLRQGKTYFYCDSCIINNALHLFEAFGRVHIKEDTTDVYSDYLRYLTNRLREEYGFAGTPDRVGAWPDGRRFVLDIQTGDLTFNNALKQTGNGSLVGVLEKRLTKDARPEDLCKECIDDRKDKPLLGLELIRGAKKAEGKEVWEGVPPGRLTLNSPDMIQQLLLDGAGIGALPCRFVAEDVRLNRLVRVLPEWSLPAIPAWAVMPMRRYLPAKTRIRANGGAATGIYSYVNQVGE